MQAVSQAAVNAYWQARKGSAYIALAQRLCREFAPEPPSVLDVGSNGTPVLEWHRATATELVSVDLRRPYEAPGVEAVTADFLAWEPGRRFELVTCLQVLEHLGEPEPFAQKLLTVGSTLVVSVPYRWRRGRCREHVQDPVDEGMLRAWFGREPVHSEIAAEPNGLRRIVQVYR